jgi:EmrB/QacA subfamily drug resistance transporter
MDVTAPKVTNHDSADAPEPAPGPETAVLAVLLVGAFILVFDSAAVVIPLPAILRDLGGTIDEATWAYAAFILAFAMFLLPAARAAEARRRRLLFVSGMAIFTLASLACALAPSMGFLIGVRAVQGLGAALAEPAIYSLVRAAFQGERRERALGAHRAAFGLAALSAPIVSGLITTGLSWEGVFYLDVAAGAVAVAGGVLVVREPRAGDAWRSLDMPGVLLGGIGLVAVLFAIVEGTRFGWRSAVILMSFAVAAVLLALFVLNELRAVDPLIDRSLFRSRPFTIGNLARAAGEFASLGLFFLLSHFLQVQLGYSALVAGALLMSVIFGAILASAVSESVAGQADVRLLVFLGFLLVAGGTFWLAYSSPHSSWPFFIAPLMIAGMGFGAQEDPAVSTALKDVPPERYVTARSISYTAYLLGIALGVAVVSGVWQSRFVANATSALTAGGLPPTAHRIASTLATGGVSGNPAAQVTGAGATDLRDLVQRAFSSAVDSALLSCVSVALLGALLALFLSARGKQTRG